MTKLTIQEAREVALDTMKRYDAEYEAYKLWEAEAIEGRKTMFLADNKAIINTQGLRWVVKADKNYGATADLEYYLEIQYKGSAKIINYKSKEERDAMFDRVSVALTQPPGRGRVG